MIIQSFTSGPFSTNSYVISCTMTKQAAVIDPAPGSSQLLIAYLNEKGLKLEKFLVTHSHWDHIADLASLKKIYPVPIYIHPLDKGNLEKPGSDGLFSLISFEGVEADLFLNEEEEVTVGQLSFKVIHTPGHTPGGVCFFYEEQKILFSGDTLFEGTIGNLSFPTAQPSLMWPSLAKLAKLPVETKVYSGHGLTTTIGREPWLLNAQQLFEINFKGE